jgi:Cu-Zn family superoxide dismutase
MAAGDHLDTEHHDPHLGPYKPGHAGDLPLIVLDSKGEAKTLILAPKLKGSE